MGGSSKGGGRRAAPAAGGGLAPTTDEEKKMLDGSVVSENKIENGGVNESNRVVLSNGEQGIHKPGSGEQGWLANISGGPMAMREVAAYRVDRELGFGTVPTTVQRTSNGKDGSFQRWVDNANPGRYYMSRGAIKPNATQLKRMKALDHVIGNLDRHGNNWLVSGKKPVAIDNGSSFAKTVKAPYGSRGWGFNRDDMRNIGLSGRSKLSKKDLASIQSLVGKPGDPFTKYATKIQRVMGPEYSGEGKITSQSVKAMILRGREITGSDGRFDSWATGLYG